MSPRNGTSSSNTGAEVGVELEHIRSIKEQYEALFAQMPLSLVVVNSDGWLIDYNEQALKQYEYAPPEFLLLRITDLEARENPEETAAHIQRVLQSGRGDFRTLHRTKTGRLLDVDVHIRVVHLPDESQVFQCVFHDVTEIVGAERSRRRESLKNETLMRIANDGLHILNQDGILVQVSDSFCRNLDYERRDVLGKHILDIDCALPRDTVFAELVRALPPEGTIMETQHKRRDGTVIDVEVTAAAVDVFGQVLVYATACDITQRKQDRERLQRSEAISRAILDNMPHLVWLKDTGGRYLGFNKTFSESVGVAKDQAVGKTDFDLWPQELAEKYSADDQRVMETRQSLYMEEKTCDKGRTYWVETYKTPIIDEAGAVLGTSGYARDITERKDAEERQELAALIYRHSSEAIMVTDHENRIIDVNEAFTAITGFTLLEVAGKNPNVLQSGRHNEEFYHGLWADLEEKGSWQGEIWDRRKNGEIFAKWTTISVIRHKDGGIFRYVAQFSDITQKKAEEEQVWYCANYDTLTNLPNRRLFLDRLNQNINKAKREGTNLALLFIDLDRFKNVNDTLGHNYGDDLLVKVAERITSLLRQTDTVARLGGDEFTVILPEVEVSAAAFLAQQIIDTLSRPFDLIGTEVVIGASIGLSLYPTDGEGLNALIKHADIAMYQAKTAGRGVYRFFAKEMNEGNVHRLMIEQGLRRALEDGGLVLHYQPKIEAVGGRIVGVEALVRWNHPDGRIILADEFIPVAEESGLIERVDDWVLNQAARQMKTWLDSGLDVGRMAVNFSTKQFRRTNLVAYVKEVLEAAHLSPDRLELEITERIAMDTTVEMSEILSAIRALGIHVSIDDFGTGYSSLGYLKNFPIDTLKIDRAFIQGLPHSPEDGAIVSSVIALAKGLNIGLVAEGAETQDHAKALAQMGCPVIQGHHYSKALPPEEFEAYARAFMFSGKV